jgi:hypothetical protein
MVAAMRTAGESNSDDVDPRLSTTLGFDELQ